MNALRRLLSSTTSTGPHGLLAGPVIAVAVVALASGCGADDTSGASANQNNAENQQNDGPQGPSAPDVVTSIDTALGSSTVAAGDVVDVSCDYLNPDGHSVDVDEELLDGEEVLLYPDDAFIEDDGQLIAQRAGSAELACQNPDVGYTDQDPAQLTIEAGDVATTVAELDQFTMSAGDSVDASCSAFDEFGNEVTDADYELVADVSSSNIIIDDQVLSATIRTTGIFTLSCHVDGPAETIGDAVEVSPGLPDNIEADPTPNQDIYSTGQVVTVGTYVTDQYGNSIPAVELDFNVYPDHLESEVLGNNRFMFYEDGTYSVTVDVDEPTLDDQELGEQLEFVVNATGPDIDCIDPVDGEMIDHPPGDEITFSGNVSDDHNVDEILINGDPLPDVGKGNFETTIETRYGINFVDIAATDEYGEENVRTCAFMISENWVDEGSYEYSWQDSLIEDVVSLQLRQDAIDDGTPASWSWQIESLNDLINMVVNSEGLRQEVEAGIIAGNPYQESTCDAQITVLGISFVGSDHTTSLDLTNDGIDLFARLNDVDIDLMVELDSWYCPGTYYPTVELEYVEMEAGTELFMSGGMPTMELDDVYYVETGEIDGSSDGFGDWFYSILTSLAQGTFSDIVEDTFEDAITDNFDELFGDLLDSFDIDSLATEFDVPRLDSNDTMTLNFDFGFSSVDTSTSRALFGLEAEISPGLDDPSDAIGTTSLGVAHPAGDFLDDPWVPTATGAGVHVSLLNQALHSLWRGGLFHADVGGALGDDLPDDVEIDLEVGLPPIVDLDDDEAELMLGAVSISLVYPGIFDEPVELDVGATATTDVSIDGDEIDFDNVELNEFHLSPRDISINSGTRDVLENFLGGLFQQILDQSVNAAIPSLPIPSFTIPDSMDGYDLPAGDDIGLTGPDLDQNSTHLRLESDFGIQ